MKKTALIFLVMFIPANVYAGDIRETPLDIVISEPLTDNVEVMPTTIEVGSDPYITLKYRVLDANQRIYKTHYIHIKNAPDDPETTEIDESTTDYDLFMLDILDLIKTRSDNAIWGDILTRYTTQAKP